MINSTQLWVISSIEPPSEILDDEIYYSVDSAKEILSDLPENEYHIVTLFDFIETLRKES
jgi:hypothetical protein